MKRREIENRVNTHAMYAAWTKGLADAARNPDVKQQLLRQEIELLPHFAEQYKKLAALPRLARRGLQRQCKRSLAAIALLLALGAQPALAATINVDGQCTLVRAIVSANNDLSPQGFCRPGRGADQIVLPRNSTQTLTRVNNTNYGATGLPMIRTIITIVGNGSTIRRTASAPPFRLLTLAQRGDITASLALNNTTLTGGRAVKSSGSDYSADGGAMLSLGGRVTLTNSKVTGNVAVTGGGVSINYNVLYPYGGSLAVINSTVSGNRASDRGGGIAHQNYSPISITNSTVSGNSAGTDGGGVYNGYASRFTAINSTISGNVAVSGDGGGLSHQSGWSVDLTHTTISGNRAGARGGGIDNRYGALTLVRSLISGSRAPQGPEVFRDAESGGEVVAARFNIFGHSGNAGLVGFTRGTTDIVPTQPLAGVLNPRLANNGGSTLTHALVNGSPAVDAVNDGTCPPPATDQRALSRPRDGNRDGGVACDVGAVEALGMAGATPAPMPLAPGPIDPGPVEPDPPTQIPTDPGPAVPGSDAGNGDMATPPPM